MNTRILNSMLLASVTLLSTALIPALAADSSKVELQRGAVNSVQVADREGGKGNFSAKFHRGGCASGKCARGGRHHHGMLGALNLTDDQYEKIFALKEQSAEQIGPRIADMISVHREMRDLMTQPNVDKSQVLSLQSKINGDKDAIANAKVSTKLDELAVLTPDQRQQLRHRFVKWSVEGGGFRRG